MAFAIILSMDIQWGDQPFFFPGSSYKPSHGITHRSKRRLNAEADLHTSWMAWEDLQNCPRPLNSMAAHLATSLREKCGWIVDQ